MFVVVKCKCDILVIECLIDSSKAPRVVSPPCKCARGIWQTKDAEAADSNSNLSPNKTTTSGLIFLNDLANSITPIPIDLHIDRGVSEFEIIFIYNN